MPLEHLPLRQGIAAASGVLYWLGVFVQARRVRRRIGRTPNLRPRGLKENLLWLGWFLVVAGWIAQPGFVGPQAFVVFRPCPELPGLGLGLGLGLVLLVAGQAGTIWCYAAMGDAWRIGVSRNETSRLITLGPYRRVRHPIYLFQFIMLAGVACLLPTAASVALILIHALCAWIKALDEEKHLLQIHGQPYRDYLARSGGFLPKLTRTPRTPGTPEL